MKEKLAALKKGSKPMDENAKSAKLNVLQEMKRMAEDAMGEKLKGVKKVTVAGSSPEAIEEGLEKAKEMIGSEESEEEVVDTEESEESSAVSDMSEEEIDAKLQELMALKNKMKVPKA